MFHCKDGALPAYRCIHADDVYVSCYTVLCSASVYVSMNKHRLVLPSGRVR